MTLSNSEAIAILQKIASQFNNLIKSEIDQIAKPGQWGLPVGIDNPASWYCAQFHNPVGANGHTGIDLNLDKSPWGDIDRGLPVYSISNGIVRARDYSEWYLGSIIVQYEHDYEPLFTRYWHLANDDVFNSVIQWQSVKCGDVIGHLGNYEQGAGGDHLHFDMALDLFDPHWWYTKHSEIRWINPVQILKKHITPEIVDSMLRRGDG